MSNNNTEEWRSLEVAERVYRISSRGRIKNLNGTIKKTFVSRDGYLRATFSIKNKTINREVHSLVAEAFIGARKKRLTVNHIDMNKSNNHVANLEYVTTSENNRKRSIMKPVRKKPSPRIDHDLVRQIRKDTAKSSKRWGEEIGRTRYVVRDIRLHKTYKGI